MTSASTGNPPPADVPEGRTIFHVDMDAFFASVEQRDHPEYRGKPVIVGARPGHRGVVSAASYEARKFGIHSAMPIGEAFSRCPQGIFVQPRMRIYEQVSNALMSLFASFSPALEQVSVDEAFLDMTGTQRLFGTATEVAAKIAAEVRLQQHLTASIGIAPNKFCAKIASDCNKPSGITMCPMNRAELPAWLAPMPVGKLWGVGTKSVQVFNGMGIQTIGDLQAVPHEMLARKFGKQGEALFRLARGIDDRPVFADSTCKSISREHTFAADSRDTAVWRSTLFTLTQDVSRRARKFGVKGSTVYITWRTPDFSRHNRQRTLAQPTNVAKRIFEEANTLLQELRESALRLLGVGISGLDTPLQMDLFADEGETPLWEASERAMDFLAERFGGNVILKGSELTQGKRPRERASGIE